jgi:hypothetical protein
MNKPGLRPYTYMKCSYKYIIKKLNYVLALKVVKWCLKLHTIVLVMMMLKAFSASFVHFGGAGPN